MRRLHSLVLLLLLPRLLPRLLLLLLLLLLMLLQLPALPVGRALCSTGACACANADPFVTRGAYVNTNTRLVAPYLDDSITCIKTLF